MPLTTTPSERIGRCTRMRRFFVRFNGSESFVRTRSSAGFTIITSGFEFSVHTGMLGTARLLGQTTGAALVSLFLARYPLEGTRISLLAGVSFAFLGAALSMLRLSPAGARGAERVRVREDQRLKG